MNWTYDATVRALYVELDARSSDHQVEVGPGVIADVADNGSLVGIEILNWQEIDVDAIAERFGLDEETTAIMKAIVYQPATAFLGYTSTAEHSLVVDVATAPANTRTPEFSRVA